MREFRLMTEDGRTAVERCACAESALERMWGLLGRRTLELDEGLLLRPAASIHTAFMRFPIDAVFVDGDGRVMRVADRIKPWRTVAEKGAKAVVELPSGAAELAHIRPGRRLLLPE